VRLTPEAKHLLALLAEKLGVSQAAVLELAIREQARRSTRVEQQEYDEIIRTLVRIAAHQDLINQKQDLLNQRLIQNQERLEVAIQAIKDILNRGNGR
jgi:hypothetical protein